jgi:prevent-host-death family protein
MSALHLISKQQINLTEDLCPLSEFRADTAAYISKIRSNQRPLALTQHGKCTAVVVSSEGYQAMIERIDFLEDIAAGEADIIAGNVIDHSDLKKKILSRFKK